MAYTPTTWANGDTITAAKLNKLEQGVANASILMVELTAIEGTADHTFAEIFEALRTGIPVYLHYTPEGGADWQEEYVTNACVMPVLQAYKYDDAYRVFASTSRGSSVNNVHHVGLPSIYVMEAASPSSYPVFFRIVYPTSTYCTANENIL